MRGLLPAILFVFLAVPVFAQTQADMDRSGCSTYKIADEELNKTYYAVRDAYAGQTLFLDRLKEAQKAWIAFRDARIKELYPAQNPQAEYGSMYPVCVCQELEWLTRTRIHQLRAWIDGIAEGETCAGSVRVKK